MKIVQNQEHPSSKIVAQGAPSIDFPLAKIASLLRKIENRHP